MSNQPSVVVIGAGEIGRAIGAVLKNKNIDVLFWDNDASRVATQKSLAEIVPSADFLFFCVPSAALVEAARAVVPYLKGQTAIISLAKGMEGSSKDTMDRLLEKFLPVGQSFAVLGGPMLAEELSKGMVGIGVVGATEKNIFEKLRELFRGTNLFLEYAGDAHSVALAGVLKNIYAIALGIADGLGWDGNQKGWLVAHSLREMAQIGIVLGAKEDVIFGDAGLGDLIATGYSPYSLNRQAGEKIVKTGEYLQSEGERALSAILDLLDGRGGELRVLTALKHVVLERQNAEIIFGKLLS